MRLYFFSLIAIIAITMILSIVMKVKDKSNAVHEGFSVVMFTFLDYVALMFYVSLNLLVMQTNWLGMILLPILFIILVFLVSFFYDNVFIKNAHLKDLTGANRNLCNLSAMIYIILCN